jgi:putative inorganic carbon (HCO3(-)) transporter
MKKSSILGFLFGYRDSEESFSSSKTASGIRIFSDKLISGFGSGFAKKFFASPISRFFSKLSKALVYTSLRCYASMLLSFGIMTLLINLSDYYFKNAPTSPLFSLIVGAVSIVLAIPLLLIDTPLSEALQSNSATDTLFFEMLCLRRLNKPDESQLTIPMFLAVLSGVAIAAIGYFLPLWAVLLTLLCAIYVFLSISSPEFSFIITVVLIPVLPLLPHSSIILASLIAISSLSFIGKVLIGKRSFHLEQYDVILFFFAMFILVSGIFNKGFESFTSSVLYGALLLGYPLASNLVTNRRIAENVTNALLVCSVPVAIFGIIVYFLAPAQPEWIDPSFAQSITSRAYSTFANPNVYAVFLIVTSVFSLVYLFEDNKPFIRILYAVCALLNLTAMLLTWTRGAWLALVITAAALLIIKSRSIPKALLIPLALIPVAILLILPAEFIQRFLSIFGAQDSSVATRLSIWRSSLAMLRDNLFFGVGVGEGSFTEEFLFYAEDGVTAPHSHNLFLEIGCQAGIFALLLFLLLIAVRIRHLASYSPLVKRSSLSSISTMTSLSIFALLTFGMTDYVFYNSGLCFLFFVLFGISSACLRISKKEYDESIGGRVATIRAIALCLIFQFQAKITCIRA